jgi:glycosyltransferase involved in cell wall biosynthesis
MEPKLETSKVSVIIPTYNREKYISKTVESLLSQTHPNLEIIIVDDGSTDQTEIKLQSLIKDSKKNISFIRRESQRKGAPVCRNIGLKKAKGKYILFLDSDDLMHKQALSNRVDFLDSNPDLDFCISRGELCINEPGDNRLLINIEKKIPDLIRFLQQDTPWLIHSALWRHQSLKTNELFWDEELDCFQDFDFHIRALIKKLKYKRIEGFADHYWRKHEGEAISKSIMKVEKINSIDLILKKVESSFMVKDEKVTTSFQSFQLDILFRYFAINELKAVDDYWEKNFKGKISKVKFFTGRTIITVFSKVIRMDPGTKLKMFRKMLLLILGQHYNNLDHSTFCKVQSV